MNLGKAAKLLVLGLTIFPSIYMALFFVGIAYAFNAAPKSDPFFNHFGWFLAVHLSVMLLMFGLLAFYIVFLFKTAAINTDLKALWAIVLFLGGPVAMPIFWYLYVWKGNPPASGG